MLQWDAVQGGAGKGLWLQEIESCEQTKDKATVTVVVRSSDDTATGNTTKDYRERWKLVNKNGWKLNERVSTEALR